MREPRRSLHRCHSNADEGKHSSRLSFTIQHDFPHHSINSLGFLTAKNIGCLVLPTRSGLDAHRMTMEILRHNFLSLKSVLIVCNPKLLLLSIFIVLGFCWLCYHPELFMDFCHVRIYSPENSI